MNLKLPGFLQTIELYLLLKILDRHRYQQWSWCYQDPILAPDKCTRSWPPHHHSTAGDVWGWWSPCPASPSSCPHTWFWRSQTACTWPGQVPSWGQEQQSHGQTVSSKQLQRSRFAVGSGSSAPSVSAWPLCWTAAWPQACQWRHGGSLSQREVPWSRPSCRSRPSSTGLWSSLWHATVRPETNLWW